MMKIEYNTCLGCPFEAAEAELEKSIHQDGNCFHLHFPLPVFLSEIPKRLEKVRKKKKKKIGKKYFLLGFRDLL